MKYVLDAQTALAWHFEDEFTAQTADLLRGFAGGNVAFVPTIFAYEVANILTTNERKKTPRTNVAKSTAFLEALADLPIETDEESGRRTADRTIELARAHGLSVYDAAYLELALRKGMPLATRDPLLVPAAKKTGVHLVLESA
jgi:predicted nucleic acid-binding protein